MTDHQPIGTTVAPPPPTRHAHDEMLRGVVSTLVGTAPPPPVFPSRVVTGGLPPRRGRRALRLLGPLALVGLMGTGTLAVLTMSNDRNARTEVVVEGLPTGARLVSVTRTAGRAPIRGMTYQRFVRTDGTELTVSVEPTEERWKEIVGQLGLPLAERQAATGLGEPIRLPDGTVASVTAVNVDGLEWASVTWEQAGERITIRAVNPAQVRARRNGTWVIGPGRTADPVSQFRTSAIGWVDELVRTRPTSWSAGVTAPPIGFSLLASWIDKTGHTSAGPTTTTVIEMPDGELFGIEARPALRRPPALDELRIGARVRIGAGEGVVSAFSSVTWSAHGQQFTVGSFAGSSSGRLLSTNLQDPRVRRVIDIARSVRLLHQPAWARWAAQRFDQGDGPRVAALADSIAILAVPQGTTRTALVCVGAVGPTTCLAVSFFKDGSGSDLPLGVAHDGRWVSITADDRGPTVDGQATATVTIGEVSLAVHVHQPDTELVPDGEGGYIEQPMP